VRLSFALGYTGSERYHWFREQVSEIQYALCVLA
jgi:hypothetical protein